MKLLVIPDIHNKIELAEAIIQQEGDADKCIFLGDLFDNFGDNPDVAVRTAEWVRNRIFDDRFIFLWGNHDLAYASRTRFTKCSGWSMPKDCAIWRVLSKACFDRFKFFWIAQGFLFTHAGLHPNFLPPIWKPKDITTANLKKYLLQESEKCHIQLDIDTGQHWFYLPGDARFSPKRGVEAGGLVWCDARQEFEAIPNIAQVFGHTILEWPMLIGHGLTRVSGEQLIQTDIAAKDHWNLALDCQLRFYAIVQHGMLLIKRSPKV